MPENSAKSPTQEWWTKTVEPFVDIWRYFRDRYTILASSGAATVTSGTLKVSPFKFAILSVVVPALLVDGAFGIWKTFRELPPTQIERRILSDKTIEEIAHKLASPLSEPSQANDAKGPDDQASRDQLQAEFDRLRKERDAGKPRRQLTPDEQTGYDKRENRLKQLAIEIAQMTLHQNNDLGREIEESSHNESMLFQAIKKFSDLESSCFLVIIGAALVLNASLFRFLVRRKRRMFPNAGSAHIVYLYAIGSLLFFPHLAAAILGVIADLAVRFDWDSYLDYHNALIALVGLWELFQLRRAVLMISLQIGDPSGKSRKPAIVIANRLVISQMLTSLAVQLAVTIIGIPVFLLILRFQG